jgi:hypothetical protein
MRTFRLIFSLFVIALLAADRCPCKRRAKAPSKLGCDLMRLSMRNMVRIG